MPIVNLDDGLRLWHKFDELSGSNIDESTAFAPSAELYGTYSRVTGIVGARALYLAIGYAELPYAGWNLRVQDSATISMWLNPDSADASIRTVFQLFGYDGPTRLANMRIHVQSGSVFFQINDRENDQAIVSSTISLNTWTHVVAVKEATTIKLYVNSVLVDTDTNSLLGEFNTNGGGGTNPRIGKPAPNSNPAWGTGTDYFGSIDDLRFYINAANQDKVTALYNYR